MRFTEKNISNNSFFLKFTIPDSLQLVGFFVCFSSNSISAKAFSFVKDLLEVRTVVLNL